MKTYDAIVIGAGQAGTPLAKKLALAGKKTVTQDAPLNKVSILGISDGGLALLSEASRQLLKQATLLVGGERHLEFAAESKAEKLVLKSNLKEVALRLESELKKADAKAVAPMRM